MTALEGAPREQGGAGGALREQRGSTKEQKGALWASVGRSRWEPDLAA